MHLGVIAAARLCITGCVVLTPVGVPGCHRRRLAVVQVTLYHWDLPAHLSTYNDSRHGWLDSDYIVPLFTQYADVCFAAFGDRVKHWTTFNEPHSFCFSGYLSVSACCDFVAFVVGRG